MDAIVGKLTHISAPVEEIEYFLEDDREYLLAVRQPADELEDKLKDVPLNRRIALAVLDIDYSQKYPLVTTNGDYVDLGDSQ